MAFDVGKRVVAESESTDLRPRSGVVEEVLRGDPSPRYRIRWDDGHESILTPASGALSPDPPVGWLGDVRAVVRWPSGVCGGSVCSVIGDGGLLGASAEAFRGVRAQR